MKANDAHPGRTTRRRTFRRRFCSSITPFVVLLVSLSHTCSSDALDIGGTIHSGHWTSNDSPFIVVSNLTLAMASGLHIGPGVTVRFKPGTQFRARGTIYAFGEPEHPVIFTADGAANPGSWEGIKLDGAGGGIFGGNCIIEYALNGISGNAAPMWDPAFQAVGLTYSTIRFCSGYGIQMTTVGFLNSRSSLDLYNVNVCSNGWNGIAFTAYNGPGWSEISGVIQNCAIFANGGDGIYGLG
jgi:hypothetical protein